MACLATLHGLHNTPLPRSQFLGQDHPLTHHFPLKQPPSTVHQRAPPPPRAKFNILEFMGGRGLCNGEKGLQEELKRQVVVDPPPSEEVASSSGKAHQERVGESVGEVPDDGFEKEMMGLTGGFPGGEKGLQKFIEKNPPPKPTSDITISVLEKAL
ncbi:hypothetical protein Fmac_017941 [Flemingia macrophylla]|uniref:Uncharacterized protein n=1 Tax=Flemingia macrophylla TaxID=520843 RepID=A0ABD1M3H5_9FABA